MTWTTPFTAVTGAVITASGHNTSVRDNLLHLRALLPDPAAANYWLQSSSTTVAAFVDRAVAVLAAIGYTPVNKAGDTMSGNLAFSDILEGIVLAGSTHIRDDNTPVTGHFQILAHNNRLVIYRQNASAIMADFNDNTLTITGLLTAGSLQVALATFTSNIIIGGSTTANAITGTTINGTTDVQKNGASVVARANHTGTQLAATISDLATEILARSKHTGTQAPATISPQGAGSTLDADNLDGTTWHAGLTAENTVGQTPSTAFADVTTGAVTLNRDGTWLIFGMAIFTASTGGTPCELRILVNGVAQTPLGASPASAGPITASTFTIVSASNGHVAKLQIRETAGGGGNSMARARIAAIWLAP